MESPTNRLPPFEERVSRCQEAVSTANDRTGGATLYLPNITGATELLERAEFVRSLGCKGVLVSPLLVGLEAVRRLSERSGLAIMAHPSVAGAFFRPDHGVAPEVLLGRLFRMVGSDAVIFPNSRGRFPFSQRTCRAISQRLLEPLGSMRPAFPVPGGGMEVDSLPRWMRLYGTDAIFLIGSSLYSAPDLERAARGFAGQIRRFDHQ